jgi:prevent-host-death family protein
LDRALFLGYQTTPRIDDAWPKLYTLRKRSGGFMAPATLDKRTAVSISSLEARTNFGRLLDRVDTERRSLVIEKRGAPKAVLLSLRDYVKLAAPEPEVLVRIGQESERKGTNKLTTQQIDAVIKATRTARKRR